MTYFYDFTQEPEYQKNRIYMICFLILGNELKNNKADFQKTISLFGQYYKRKKEFPEFFIENEWNNLPSTVQALLFASENKIKTCRLIEQRGGFAFFEYNGKTYCTNEDVFEFFRDWKMLEYLCEDIRNGNTAPFSIP